MFGAWGWKAEFYTHAATGPAIYNVYEANVTDEDAYKKALPEVQKIIKENSGVYLAGGFNKAKTDSGKPETGNRFVMVRYDSDAAYDKFWNGGGKAWIENTRLKPVARELRRRTKITRVRRRAAQAACCFTTLRSDRATRAPAFRASLLDT